MPMDIIFQWKRWCCSSSGDGDGGKNILGLSKKGGQLQGRKYTSDLQQKIIIKTSQVTFILRLVSLSFCFSLCTSPFPCFLGKNIKYATTCCGGEKEEREENKVF